MHRSHCLHLSVTATGSAFAAHFLGQPVISAPKPGKAIPANRARVKAAPQKEGFGKSWEEELLRGADYHALLIPPTTSD